MSRTEYQPGPATDHYHDTLGVEETTIAASAEDIVASLLDSLPTSDPGVAGQLWNDSGTLMVSAG